MEDGKNTCPKRVDCPRAIEIKKDTTTITHSNLFCRICDDTFDTIDTDISGFIDERELYNGLLLIHLQLASFAGPIACKPLTRSKVNKLIQSKYDGSRKFDKKQFRDAMMMLTPSLFNRIIMQWTIILVIVPFLAQYISDRVLLLMPFCWSHRWLQDIKDKTKPLMSEHCKLFDADIFTQLGRCVMFIIKYLEMIPIAAWRAMILTLVTCVLSLLFVPQLLLCIESRVTDKSTGLTKMKKLLNTR
mmetsp:Transcript_27998/g.41854  ORF Transcript_27998/g.41854 Transcript_27998/m.41854 type:complete len:245 (-) Transcript_27998:57-791(-)